MKIHCPGSRPDHLCEFGSEGSPHPHECPKKVSFHGDREDCWCCQGCESLCEEEVR